MERTHAQGYANEITNEPTLQPGEAPVRPPPQPRHVTRTIDSWSAALDEARNEKGACPPFAEVAEEWRLFAIHVGAIDKAMDDPIAVGASAILLTAAALHDEVYEIGIALSNIGEALVYRGDPVQLTALKAKLESDGE